MARYGAIEKARLIRYACLLLPLQSFTKPIFHKKVQATLAVLNIPVGLYRRVCKEGVDSDLVITSSY